MLNGQSFDLLHKTPVAQNAPGFIVYCEKPGHRLSFTCDFIFKRVLRVNHVLTSDLHLFINSGFHKINYSSETLPALLQVKPHNLLFEQGISETKPQPFFENEMIYFFRSENVGGQDQFRYDIFSAVFYFISRYEEWQRFEKDSHQRFESKASLLSAYGFQLKPVVDVWIAELKQFLTHVSAITFPEEQFHVISTIDVDNLFAYREKGLWRTLGASFRDLVNGDLDNFRHRINVLGGRMKDPFDVYADLSEFGRGLEIPMAWFFLLRTGTQYDRTVNPASKAFQAVFEVLEKNSATIGLHPSYHSAFDKGCMQHEVELISERLNSPVKVSRQHYLRFDIRTTPLLLMQNGITTDCSMGYASSPGFRAGTAYPFFYFDFSKEKQTELLFLPFCAMDGAYFIYDQMSPDESLKSMLQLAAEIKKTGGYFVTVFHERTFSNHLYPGFGTLYKKLHLGLKEL